MSFNTFFSPRPICPLILFFSAPDIYKHTYIYIYIYIYRWRHNKWQVFDQFRKLKLESPLFRNGIDDIFGIMIFWDMKQKILLMNFILVVICGKNFQNIIKWMHYDINPDRSSSNSSLPTHTIFCETVTFIAIACAKQHNMLGLLTAAILLCSIYLPNTHHVR